MAGVNTLVGQSEERGALSLVYCATVPELQGAPARCPCLDLHVRYKDHQLLPVPLQMSPIRLDPIHCS